MEIMPKTRPGIDYSAMAMVFALFMALFGSQAVAHEEGPISDHSPDEDNIYVGYGPVWDYAFSGWNQARINATNACVADGNAECTMSVAASDHCTFWGEGEWQHDGNPRYICVSHPLVTDSDGDGVPDDVDACPNTTLGGEVSVASIETGVENDFSETSGCSTQDRVDEVVSDCSVARNHGQFVSCFTRGTNSLRSSGVITGKEKGALQKAAAQADIP